MPRIAVTVDCFDRRVNKFDGLGAAVSPTIRLMFRPLVMELGENRDRIRADVLARLCDNAIRRFEVPPSPQEWPQIRLALQALLVMPHEVEDVWSAMKVPESQRDGPKAESRPELALTRSVADEVRFTPPATQ